VYLPLPIATAGADERRAAVRRRMEAIKATPEAVMAFGVLGAMGLASVAVERLGIALFTSKATVMVTSVPGPSAPVGLAGRPVRSMAVWAPASGTMALTASILSYAGEVRVGIATDERVVADPAAITAALDAELAALS
jgi:hypothetical protein